MNAAHKSIRIRQLLLLFGACSIAEQTFKQLRLDCSADRVELG
jgi:hypothetical protein